MITIPVITERCAGIDVGKRGLAAAVAVGPADKEAEIKTRWFAATMPALCDLHAWLREEGCTTVAMESTGSWWISVKNELGDDLRITLVCPRKHHPKKGEKTDFRDAVDLAVHHRHGLLTGSFRPERGIVELRDLTRRRKKLLGNLGSEKNRIQKLLDNEALSAEQMADLKKTAAQPHPGAYRGFTGSEHARSSPLAHPAERGACAVSGPAGGKPGEKDRQQDLQ